MSGKLRSFFYWSVAGCAFFIHCIWTLFYAKVARKVTPNYLRSNATIMSPVESNNVHFDYLPPNEIQYATLSGTSTTHDPRKAHRHRKLKPQERVASPHNSTQANIDARRTVGFFNMFEGENDVFNRIVAEQLTSIDKSGVLNKIDFISYVYFGPNYLSFVMPSHSKKYVKSPVSNAAGNEIDTLELLHGHCIQHRKDHVFYLHTKGSYHPRDSNERLRQNLMKALLFCVDEDDALGDGDVCGLRVSPVPYPQISGPRIDPCPIPNKITSFSYKQRSSPLNARC